MVGLTFNGGPELEKALNALSDELKPLVLYEGLREAGEPMRAEMARLAPRDATPDGPHLADNIVIGRISKIDGVKLGEDEVAVGIGPAKGNSSKYFYYGYFIEHGFYSKGPRPFMRPAFDANVGKALTDLAAIFWRILTGTGEVRR